MPKNVGIIRFSGPWIQVIQNEFEARIKYRRTEPVFTGSVLASNIASFLHSTFTGEKFAVLTSHGGR